MKWIAIIATSLLLLTSCSSAPPAKTFALGKVVGCSQINVDKKFIGGIKVPCLDGSQSITLQALRGPMVLNVWGSWCYSCKTELPYFRDFYQSSLGKVQLVGVDVEEATIADARTFVVNQGSLMLGHSIP